MNSLFLFSIDWTFRHVPSHEFFVFHSVRRPFQPYAKVLSPVPKFLSSPWQGYPDATEIFPDLPSSLFPYYPNSPFSPIKHESSIFPARDPPSRSGTNSNYALRIPSFGKNLPMSLPPPPQNKTSRPISSLNGVPFSLRTTLSRLFPRDRDSCLTAWSERTSFPTRRSVPLFSPSS